MIITNFVATMTQNRAQKYEATVWGIDSLGNTFEWKWVGAAIHSAHAYDQARKDFRIANPGTILQACPEHLIKKI
jgi:hypothetical protein